MNGVFSLRRSKPSLKHDTGRILSSALRPTSIDDAFGPAWWRDTSWKFNEKCVGRFQTEAVMDLYSNSLDSELRIDGFMLDGVLLSKLVINKYIEQWIFAARRFNNTEIPICIYIIMEWFTVKVSLLPKNRMSWSSYNTVSF